MTQQQWYDRLKTWVPKWFWENEVYSQAHFMALAKLLAERQTEISAILAQTYLSTASGTWLDLHGKERNTPRISGESDDSYRVRIRLSHTSSEVHIQAIRTLVAALMPEGETAVVTKDSDGSVFFDRAHHFDRKHILFDAIKNGGFMIYVDNQGDFELLENIVAAVNQAKAFGTVFRLVERTT